MYTYPRKVCADGKTYVWRNVDVYDRCKANLALVVPLPEESDLIHLFMEGLPWTKPVGADTRKTLTVSLQLRVRAAAVSGAIVLLSLFSTGVFAECSDARVKQMSRQGKTVASIARNCEMSKDDVNSILDDEDEDKEDTNGGRGLPAGSPLGQCGCWGSVHPGMRQPDPRCQSGYAGPSMCNAACPLGGFMWRGVCA